MRYLFTLLIFLAASLCYGQRSARDSFYVPPRKAEALKFKVIRTGEYLRIELGSPEAQKVTAVMYNIAGQELAHKSIDVTRGMTTFTMFAPAPTGVYIIRLSTHSDHITHKTYIQ